MILPSIPILLALTTTTLTKADLLNKREIFAPKKSTWERSPENSGTLLNPELYKEPQPLPARVPYNDDHEQVNGMTNTYTGPQLTLDEILKDPRARQIIEEEAQRRVLERMNKVTEQVAEEIVETVENDAEAAMIAERENSGSSRLPLPGSILVLVWGLLFRMLASC